MKLASLTSFLIIFFVAIATPPLYSQSQDCDAFPLLPELIDGELSNDVPSLPCGFEPIPGFYVNECSPCGFRISDDDCVNAPLNSLCQMDGFESIGTGYTNDVFQPTLGFCGPGTATNNNFWIGFIAQSNSIALEITTFNCVSPNNFGMQFAICETDCATTFNVMSNNAESACISVDANQSGLFNDTAVLTANNLIPGNPYYVLGDAFAGSICRFQLNVLDGFSTPDIDIITTSGVLCPDVLNGGEFTDQVGGGADVTLNLNDNPSREFTFLWQDPNGNLIASTTGEVIADNFVRGTLDGSFFSEPGIHTVTILDDETCCTLCSELEFQIIDLAPSSIGVSGAGDELNCENPSTTLEANPEDGSVPIAEQWMLVNASGERINLVSSLVASNGRVNILDIDTELVQQYFPGQDIGSVIFIYGFLTDFNEICFNETTIEIPFDFRLNDPNNPDQMNCITVSTNSLLDAGVDLFPNPSNGKFQISFEADLTLELVHLYNIFGQLVKEITHAGQSQVLGIQAHDLPSGTYFIDAQFTEGVYRQKMVINK